MNYIKFHFKTDHKGSGVPCIYGSLPELGNGNAARAIELKPCESIYNYIAEVRVRHQRNQDDNNWYSYCYRPRFGAIVHETGPKRFLPKISSASGSVLEIYDTSDSALAVCELVVRFRVKYHTNIGEELFVVGDCKELGNWQPKSAQQLFYEKNSDSWVGDVCFPLTSSSRTIQYKYFISNDTEEIHWEPEENHIIHLSTVSSPAFVEVIDTFRWNDSILNTFTRSGFTEVLSKRKSPTASPQISPNSVKPGEVSINFSVMCPYVKKNQSLCIVGSCKELGEWDPKKAFFLSDSDFPLWNGALTVNRFSFPFEYKYVIYDKDAKKLSSSSAKEKTEDEKEVNEFIWEQYENRKCNGITGDFVDDVFPATIIISDWYISPNDDLFRGMGIHVPLYSLRTDESLGNGQFSDIRILVDLCKLIGSRMIELLPLNDTNSNPNSNDNRDSSPYRIISAFALNPIYINVLEILPSLPDDIYRDITVRKSQFEQRREVDYSDVYHFKDNILHRIFNLIKLNLDKNKDFEEFCRFNEEWLNAYSLYCVIRNEKGNSDYWEWNLKINGNKIQRITIEEINKLSIENQEEILFNKWVQYVADRQLKASIEYASSSGIVINVDVPFGVQRNSCDCWSNSRLFNINYVQGLEPTEQNFEGENYGYAAYNWDVMKADNYSWWRLRMRRLSDLFHSVHIDHIENFFRSWLIQGNSLLGHYSPSVCVTKDELDKKGLWDIDRYVLPYVRFHLLQEKFGNEAQRVANEYFVPRGLDFNDDYYKFKDNCDTSEKINALVESLIGDESKRIHYKACLNQLLNNVILMRSPSDENKFYFRSNLTVEHVENNGTSIFKSSSFSELDYNQQQQLLGLYDEFKFGRQINLWLPNGISKLEMIQKSSNLSVFADFGIDYADGLFEKEAACKSFVKINGADYLSQRELAPLTEPTIRLWWEKNTERANAFWVKEMKQNPQKFDQYCLCDILTNVIRFALSSKSMWTVFTLQDLVNTFNCLRKEYPTEETVFKYGPFNGGNWYRFPWKLEDLINYGDWTNYIRDLVHDANRQ